MKHVGCHANRLEPSQNNPREVAFAEHWAKENELSHVLAVILTRQEGGHPFMPFTGKTVELEPYDQHAATVAATVIQWLGSNIGFSFLETALAQCGYKIVPQEGKVAAVFYLRDGKIVAERPTSSPDVENRGQG